MARQIGTFTMGVDQIEDPEMAEPLMAVFGTTIVLEAGYDYRTRTHEYLALCPAFEEVEDGEEIPAYEPSMDEQGNVTWEKQ